MNIIGFDVESFRIGQGAVVPELVCGSFDFGDGKPYVVSRWHDDQGGVEKHIQKALDEALYNDGIIAIHSAAFDVVVCMNAFPNQIPQWFHALDEGRVICTIVREKLLNLSSHGHLDDIYLPDGSNQRISYSLATVVLNYFGEDRSAEKGVDTWRLNYGMLAKLSASKYPKEAYDYALQDAIDARRLYFAQEERKAVTQCNYPNIRTTTQDTRTRAAVALFLATAWGWCVDSAEKRSVEAMLDHELSPTKMRLLLDNGIIRAGSPPVPYAKGTLNPDGTPKMKAAVEESLDTKALKRLVAKICTENGIKIKETASGAVSADKDMIGQIDHLNPIIKCYQNRQKLQKLRTTELPRISGTVCHSPFKELVETGRTSSYEMKENASAGRRALYPSLNGQNVDPRVRPIMVPRPGYLFFSVDYHAIDLVAAAWTCLKLFGYSVLADTFNADIDPHARLAAPLAYYFQPEFAALCQAAGLTTPQSIEVFHLFNAQKKALTPGFNPKEPTSGWLGGQYNEELKKKVGGSFFKHMRTFSKPTGLGYWGGLGPDTFIEYARSPYEVIVNKDEAIQMREVWRTTIPEGPEYLKYIGDHCKDPTSTYDDPLYCYDSPLGMHRARATWSATANGLALQTPEAEGAVIACYELQKTIFNNRKSLLYGKSRLITFVHDEFFGEVYNGDGMAHERVEEIQSIVQKPMQDILEGVKVKTAGALMRRWYKQAEPSWQVNNKGEKRLVPWFPSE